MASNGCFIAVLIARTTDHLPLCLYIDESYRNSNTVRKQCELIVERMQSTASYRPDGGHRSGSAYQSFDHKECIYFGFQDAATELTIVAAVNKLLLRNSGDINGTNKLACGLIDTIFTEFVQAFNMVEVKMKSVRPFQYIKFESTIQRCVTRAIQQDNSSGSNLVIGAPSNALGSNNNINNSNVNGSTTSANGMTTGKLSQRRQVNAHYENLRNEITDVHMVMRKNLEDLMVRGEKLETMNQYSAQLVDQSSRYYKKTVKLNRMRLLRLYGPPAIVILFMLIVFFYYIHKSFGGGSSNSSSKTTNTGNSNVIRNKK